MVAFSSERCEAFVYEEESEKENNSAAKDEGGVNSRALFPLPLGLRGMKFV